MHPLVNKTSNVHAGLPNITTFGQANSYPHTIEARLGGDPTVATLQVVVVVVLVDVVVVAVVVMVAVVVGVVLIAVVAVRRITRNVFRFLP